MMTMESRSISSSSGLDEVVDLDQVRFALHNRELDASSPTSDRVTGWGSNDELEHHRPSKSHSRKMSLGDTSQVGSISERVIINVGGQMHETFLATLSRLPDTRLAKVAQDCEDDPAYDKATGHFFFNRNPSIFLSILQYYRTGELHIDHSICGNAIKNEFDFWQIDANDIEPCCWAQYAKFLENKETLKMLDDSFAIYEDVFAEPEGEDGWRKLQRRLWRHLEDPSYSVIGKIFAIVSLFFVVVSILSYVLGTHNNFRVLKTDFLNATYDSNNSNDSCSNDNSNSFSDLNDYNSDVVWWLDCVTFACFGWFALEYFLRLICCPNKKEFFSSVLNNVDVLVLIAMLIESLAVILVDQIPSNSFLKILIPLRFARIIRIMKLMKHYRAFKVLLYTIKVSAKELALMIIFLVIGVVIFACLVYYVEPDNFTSIPIACWWALVTMTTVGYGDYRPNEVGGYFIGCVAAICGVLMIAFTVPIVVNNFSLYYSHAQTRAKMRPKRRATKLLNKLAALTMFVPTLAEHQQALALQEQQATELKLQNDQKIAAKLRGRSVSTSGAIGDSGSLISQKPHRTSEMPISAAELEEKELVKKIRERGRRASRLAALTVQMISENGGEERPAFHHSDIGKVEDDVPPLTDVITAKKPPQTLVIKRRHSTAVGDYSSSKVHPHPQSPSSQIPPNSGGRQMAITIKEGDESEPSENF